MTDVPRWHALTVEQALQRLGSTLEGLSPDQVEQSRRQFGPNVLPPPKGRTPFQVFIDQFRSALIYILVVAGGISLLLREWQDGLVIFAVVVLNAIIGFRQEIQANQAMVKLLQMAPQVVHVLRHGQERELPAGQLVVGDIVLLGTGDGLPADGRWVEAINVRANESSLTGESVPVEKISGPLPAHTIIQDQRNMGWRGTLVVGGRGKFLVTAVGPATRFGEIVAKLQQIDHTQTPFQRKLAAFARRLAALTLFLGLVIFLLGLARQLPFQKVFLLAISMIVSIIPEGLPVVITVAMAYGMWAMARRRAIVRKLVAVETLGAVTVVAADKTGTLTYGEMMMEKAWVDGRAYHLTGEGYRPEGDVFLHGQKISVREQPGLSLLLRLGALNNDSRFTTDEHNRRIPIGDPTELALVVAAAKGGWSKLELETAHPRLGEFPFDYQLKYMVTWHQDRDQRTMVIIKGAPQAVLQLCSHRWQPGGFVALTDAGRAKVMEVYEQWAKDALRGLAIGYAIRGQEEDIASMEFLGRSFTFAGLVGLQDALRPEARGAIATMRQAGIRTIMVTGDFQATGRAVAERLGLLEGAGPQALLDGGEVDRLNDQQLQQRLVHTRVGTRLTPEHKFRIARLLKQAGEVVAMTGDGINDVPALLEANVGVAVGQSASDAAKEAADMLLIDGNFQSITTAIAEGRRIFRNIRRVIYYLLATSFGELALIMTALLAGLPLPLLPTQIIWLNFVTGPFLGIALTREPMAPSVMQERPHNPRDSIVTRAMWERIVVIGLTIAASAFLVFGVARMAGVNDGKLYALVLTAMVAAEVMNAITARSSKRSILTHFGGNPGMTPAIVGVLALQASILYIPSLAAIFHIEPISLADWLLVGLASLPVLLVEEARKWWIRRRYQVSTVPVSRP